MSIPVPPRVVRRVFCHPIQAVLALATLLVLGIATGLALVIQLPGRRRRLVRVLIMLAAAVAADLSVIVGAWRLWLTHRLGRRSTELWQTDHVELIGRVLHRVEQTAERVAGLRLNVTVDPSLADESAPLLVLARHAGVGDSPLIAYLLTYRLGRVPRVLLKRFLLWDAAIDLVLGRLGAHFLPPRRVGSAERERGLQDFVAATGAGDALLLFPEGRNWTPSRWRAQVAEAGEDEADWMRAHPAVLPPRAGGAARLLDIRPGLRCVLAAQRGLEGLHSVRSIWSGVPLRQPVEVTLSLVRPPSSSALQPWLLEQWAQIDEWTREQWTQVISASDDPTGAPSPT
jgi:hypothetical protein